MNLPATENSFLASFTDGPGHSITATANSIGLPSYDEAVSGIHGRHGLANQIEKLILLSIRDISNKQLRPDAASDLFSIGFDSLGLVGLSSILAGRTGFGLSMADLRAYPTPGELAVFLSEKILLRATRREREFIRDPGHSPKRAVPASAQLASLIHNYSFDPVYAAYQAQSALIFVGQLDVPALEAALADLIARHETLRTTYGVDAGGHAMQTIHAPWSAALTLSKVKPGPSGQTRHELLSAWHAASLPPPFNPAQLPLIRWRLLKISDTEHVLLQSEHAFLHDGWSSKILRRDLAEFYNIRAAASDRVCARQCLQFSEFCSHERNWLHSREIQKSIQFWREYLRGACALLELRGAMRRDGARRADGAQRRLSLPHSIWALILATAARLRLTPYRLMFAIFSEVVAELSGKTDLLIGTEVANRSQREFHNTAGMLANLLPVRILRDATESWLNRIEKHARALHEALLHEAVPLPAIIAVTDLKERLAGIPPVQICFSFHNALAHEEVQFAGLEVETVEAIHSGGVKHELSATVIPPGAGCTDGFALLFSYNTSIYYGAIVDTLIRDYVRQLEALGDLAQR